MSKATPGPWKAEEDSLLIRETSELVGILISNGPELVAVIPFPDGVRPYYADADAALIAAAPELRDALRELVESPNAKENALWDRARALLEKL